MRPWLVFDSLHQAVQIHCLSTPFLVSRSNIDDCGFPQANRQTICAILPRRAPGCASDRADGAILIDEDGTVFRATPDKRRHGGGRPLLRMPPFPGARPVGGPIWRKTGQALPAALQATDIGALAEQIAKARVGGSFWKPAPTGHAHPDSFFAATAQATMAGDPWPMIDAKQPIVAHLDEEIALLAGAGGSPVLSPGNRRPYPREDILRALRDRLVAFDYFDPWNGQPISIATWIDILADWRRIIDRNREIAVVCGIATWKRPALAKFLWAGQAPKFSRKPPESRSPPGKTIAVWPSRVPRVDCERVHARDGRLVQIEDGFIRSAGLGARLVPPCSIVVDCSGIYYDPRTPSDLEHLLAAAELGPDLCSRAAQLIGFVTRHGITKYGGTRSPSLHLPAAKRKILVAGQVADDRSVQLGAAGVTGALDLLRRVREIEPEAFIIFKPHPDVEAGLRPGDVPAIDAERYVDLILPDAPMDSLLAEVDAVHVLTSLTGFEALLRGREVITHGLPFYAGWGLTQDLAAPIARRQRKLTLEQLVAATLILYPRYCDPVTRLPCPPEVLAQRLSAGSMPKPGLLQKLRSVQGQWNLARRQWANML